ncbi:GNAT family N-acetyltransferase [Halomonas sp. HMF6819]|uniref:GNAT family N-acetyltransferase n=1 Tax=Halomonas sp. HMF6819 TaxID=3373085 RepID=UPI0037A39CD4
MSEPFSIERLHADSPHLPTVTAWTFAMWGHLHPGQTFEQALDETRGECGARGVPSLFVALEHGEPVGTASLIAEDMPHRPELSPWLASVFVVPSRRGRQIASQLVRRVEQEARANAIERLYLYTPDQQALYQRLGWQPVARDQCRGEDVTIMSRTFDRHGDAQ